MKKTKIQHYIFNSNCQRILLQSNSRAYKAKAQSLIVLNSPSAYFNRMLGQEKWLFEKNVNEKKAWSLQA